MRAPRDSIEGWLRDFPPSRLRAGVAALLLPLSAVPVAFAAPRVADSYRSSPERPALSALDAPQDVLTRLERERFAPVSVRRENGGIPVLAYHAIQQSDDPYSVTQEQFARHMAMLDAAGYESITDEQFARTVAGQDVELPERPILITFDDSRTSSFEGADEVLEEHGFRATMFVIAGRAERDLPGFLTWGELRSMASSGRWDIQNHAGRGHRMVRSGPATTGPAYGNRIWRDGRLETRDAAMRRITTDVSWGARRLREEVPGAGKWLFAVPFGSFGGGGDGNDPQLTDQVGRWLTRHYAATFLQREDPDGGRPGDGHHVVFRHSIHSDTTAATLYRRLCDCNTKEATR